MWAYVENYPFSFVLVSAFAMVNGLFFYLLRAPTALGRPIMDQLAGLRLYLQTAESDRLNLNAPEITAERFEALLPYAVALDVEKPWSDAFASALRRAHPGDADPMSRYRSGWSSGSWSSSNFSSAVSSSISGVSSALASRTDEINKVLGSRAEEITQLLGGRAEEINAVLGNRAEEIAATPGVGPAVARAIHSRLTDATPSERRATA